LQQGAEKINNLFDSAKDSMLHSLN
jgi:hypothetical protein